MLPSGQTVTSSLYGPLIVSYGWSKDVPDRFSSFFFVDRKWYTVVCSICVLNSLSVRRVINNMDGNFSGIFWVDNSHVSWRLIKIITG